MESHHQQTNMCKISVVTVKDLPKINELENELNLINIWASWCLPCKAEHPYLINLNERFDINLIGINYKDNLDNSKKFLSDLGNPYDEVLVDSDGIKSIELGAIGVPETYLINNEYKIIKKFIM